MLYTRGNCFGDPKVILFIGVVRLEAILGEKHIFHGGEVNKDSFLDSHYLKIVLRVS